MCMCTLQSAFELKAKKTVKQLLDSAELDPSMSIRIQVCFHVCVVLRVFHCMVLFAPVIRAFGEMKYYNHSIVEYLHKKCAGQEITAR